MIMKEKIKKKIGLLVDPVKLRMKVNTLENKNALLEWCIKESLYYLFMNNIDNEEEIKRLKEENKKLRHKTKELKDLLK